TIQRKVPVLLLEGGDKYTEAIIHITSTIVLSGVLVCL
ncbi:MAG: hypothetical protein ACI8RD_010042, partial [Bacillariaceae sp.]